MKIIATLILSASFGLSAVAQTDTIINGGFENWGNTVPAGDTCTEPANWYSDQSGSNVAKLGPQTCVKSTTAHSGLYSVQVTTESYTFVSVTEAINGVVTTGVVNAPTIFKTDGYIGTENYSDSTGDSRRMSFTGRPDSLVGWYQYTKGGVGEQGKVRAILHIGQYYDPETPTTYHPDPTANKIADALFYTDTTSVSTWTRFSVPFNYASANSPDYIMINVTSSANQNTSVSGSTLLLDDLQVVYNATAVNNVTMKEEANVYSYDKTVCINFSDANEARSVISIMDITGKDVFSQTITDKKFSSYNLYGLNTGIYIYRLSNSGYCKTGKLFIQ